MVGDNPKTDIIGANNIKMKSALILKLGIMVDNIKKYVNQALNLFLEDAPTYIIEEFKI